MTETYIIIDGNYLLARSVHAGLGVKTSLREPTGGIFLFLKTLKTIVDAHKNFLVVFDRGKNPHRLEIYPDYKKRKIKEKTDKDEEIEATFKFTFGVLDDLLRDIGIPFVKIPKCEADDIIFFLAKFLGKAYDVIVASDDSDYIQMLDIGAKIFRPMKDDTISLGNLDKIFPFDIKYYTLWKSLCGDVSDNITGIPRIGNKTATEIIKYLSENDLSPTLDSLKIWANSGNLKKHEAFKISENIAIIDRNLKLIDIKLMDQDELLYIKEYKNAVRGLSPNYEELLKKFNRFEIKTLPYWNHFCLTQVSKMA